jgi:FKBP-type peptidyl-prolyl cis-trans isomerase
MCKKLIMILIAVIVSTVLYAQNPSKPSGKGLTRGRLPKPIYNLSRPTRVTGDGMSTPSGVKYWDIQTGEGKAAEKGHVVQILFKEWIRNGKEIGSSISRDKPTVFTLGVGQVIKGWEDGVEGMKPGGKRQILIPPDLAYGAAGVPPVVPPNSTLIFDIELIGVQ